MAARRFEYSSIAGNIVEVIDGKRLVLPNVIIREELLVLLHSAYPDPLTETDITNSLDRRKPAYIRQELSWLWKNKQVELTKDGGYILTQLGYSRAVEIIRKHIV